MMIRFRMYLVSAVAAVLLLCSCSNKTNKQGRYAPKDAVFALHINGRSLTSKLPWEEIKSDPFFTQMIADSSIPAFVQKVLDNPDNSGVDIKTDMLLYAQMDTLGGAIVFSGSIKDAEKFRSFNLAMTQGSGSETKDGDNNFISKAPLCVGWNKERFVYLVDMPEMNIASAMKHYTDDNYVAPKPRDIAAACRSVFALKESNSLGDDPKFTELVKKEGDLHFWVNIEEIQKATFSGTGGMEAMMMKNVGKLCEGSITTAALNFTNGKINIDAKSYAGKELSSLYKKYSGDNINENMIKMLPAKNVAAVFALNFKPQGIVELLKLLGMDGMANLGLATVGFTLDDFVKANKGDIILAVSDLKPVTDSVTDHSLDDGKEGKITRTEIKPDVLFAATIDDKVSFNKLISAGEKAGSKIGKDIPVSYKNNDSYFAIGNNKENVDRYIAGGADSKFDFLSKISGSSMGGFIDIQLIMKAYQSEITKDSSAVEVFNASLKMWESVYFKGGSYSDGGISQTIEINLIDKNTNSLKQLKQYFSKIAQIDEAKRKRYEIEDRQMTPTVDAPLTTMDTAIMK